MSDSFFFVIPVSSWKTPRPINHALFYKDMASAALEALPYLAAALCARAKLLSDPENPFVKNAMCALWNCVHAIVTDHRAWQDMEGKCAVSEQDVATLEEQAWVSLVSSLELLEEAGILSFLQRIDTVLVHVKDFVEKYAGVDENQLQSTVEH